MSVYVDALQQYPSGQWCHMAADSADELHALAARIGLRRAWAQVSTSGVLHYDLRPSKRALAVQCGAREVSGRELLEKACRVK